MITLHGFAMSNYYNIVKHVLLYKDIPFEEHDTLAPDVNLSIYSPANKVPALTTDDGEHLSESSVLCDYLEDAYPEPALYPADPVARAKVRQIMKVAELYLELPSRHLVPFSLFGKTPPDTLRDEVVGAVAVGSAAMNQLCSFSPFLTGDTLTMADIYVRYVNSVVKLAAAMLDQDIVGGINGMTEWDAKMAESDISRRVDADQAANEAPFMAYVKRISGG